MNGWSAIWDFSKWEILSRRESFSIFKFSTLYCYFLYSKENESFSISKFSILSCYFLYSEDNENENFQSYLVTFFYSKDKVLDMESCFQALYSTFYFPYAIFPIKKNFFKSWIKTFFSLNSMLSWLRTNVGIKEKWKEFSLDPIPLKKNLMPNFDIMKLPGRGESLNQSTNYTLLSIFN